MCAADVLHLIRESGLTVTADGDRLIVNPADRLTDDLRTLIRDNKPDVLVALESESAELTRLGRLHGERYGFTETEHAEARAAALADPVDALTCFRAMAAEVAATTLSDGKKLSKSSNCVSPTLNLIFFKRHRPTTGETNHRGNQPQENSD